MKTDLSRLTLSQLEELTGKSHRFLKGRLAVAGVRPVGKDGRSRFYPSRAALAAVLAGDGERLDAAQEKARLDRARREQAELDLALKRRQVLDLDEVIHHWSSLAVTCKMTLRALPGRMHQTVPGFTKAMARRMSALIDEALLALANDDGVPRPTKRRRGSRHAA